MSNKNRKKSVIYMLFTLESLTVSVAFASQVNSLNNIPSVQPGTQVQSVDMSLYLMIKINNQSTQNLINVKYSQQKKNFMISAEDLKKLRIKLPELPAGNPWVDIAKLKGIEFIYIPDEQMLNLYVQQAQLSAYEISLSNGSKNDNTLLKKNALTSAIINYNLYDTHYNGDDYISGSLEGLLNFGVGNFYTSGLYNNKSNYGDEGTVRMDSYWQYIDAEKIRSYTLGDFTTNSVSWGNSVRIAGFQWASAYSQRSDIVTTALPQFSGSSAVPSSLDLFVDQHKIYSGDIPSGPFDIKNLPFVSGNDVTIVTKDANGQQISSTHSYYYSPELLREGINEFSIDIGIPRFNYATESTDYDKKIVFMSGSKKYGLTNSTSMTLNGQGATNGLTNSGFGVAQSLFGVGILNFGVAGSHFKNNDGILGQVSLAGRVSHNMTFNSNYQKSGNNYYDLAKASNFIYIEKYHNNASNDSKLTYESQSSEIARIGVNFSPAQSWSFGTYYNHLVYPKSRYNLISLNANAGIIPDLNVSANIYKNLSGNDAGGYIVMTYQLNNKYNISSAMNKDNGRNGYTQQIDSIPNSGINAYSWGVSSTCYSDSITSSQVYGSYRGRYGTYNSSFKKYGSLTETSLSTSGALVFADRGIYPANKIGQSFVLVKNAGPGTHILNGGVDLGAADSRGHFLITDMMPYTENHIFLDTTNLPVNWQIRNTEKVAVSGYHQGSLVNFEGRNDISATVLLVDKDNNLLPPGYKVILNNSSESITGYGGEVYLEQLAPNNTLIVNLLDRGTCITHFSHSPKKSSTVKAGPYVCR